MSPEAQGLMSLVLSGIAMLSGAYSYLGGRDRSAQKDIDVEQDRRLLNLEEWTTRSMSRETIEARLSSIDDKLEVIQRDASKRWSEVNGLPKAIADLYIMPWHTAHERDIANLKSSIDALTAKILLR